MSTPQEVFSHVWLGMRAQGFRKTGGWDRNFAPARGGDDFCLKCALVYAWDLDRSWALRYENQGLWQMESDLRACHDEARSPEDMEQRFREYAIRYGFTIPGTEDAAYTAFKARILAPLPVTA